MKITECLLDTRNTLKTGGVSIASLVLSQKKKHLWDNRPSKEIDTIVIHYISAENTPNRLRFNLGCILKTLCDFGVSSHYLIERSGKILRLVPENKKAWHAGGSIMPGTDGRTAVNNFSLGIELVATPDSGFTTRQFASCVRLCRDIEKRYGKKFTFLGHQHIAGKAAVRLGLRAKEKLDPGPLFNWKSFRKLIHLQPE
jgi:AmpD protein